MHFSKIYLQDNFVPNIVEDQFRRKVIGIEVTIDEYGEDIERAKELAEQYIKDYIQKNTVYPEHNHIETRTISTPIPDMQIEKGEMETSLEEQIMSCKDIKVLESYKLIIKGNPSLGKIYNKQMLKLS